MYLIFIFSLNRYFSNLVITNMKKLLFLSYLVIGLGQMLRAQTADHRWALGLNFGISEYYGDLGNGFLKFDLGSNRIYTNNKITTTNSKPGYVGLNASRYLNTRFDLNMSLLRGEEGYFRNIDYYYNAKFTYADVTARWKFMAKDFARFTPYFLTGIGTRYTDYNSGNDFSKDGTLDLVIPLGIGLNIKCEERFYINIQSYYGWTNGDKVEGSTKYTRFSYDQLWHHSVGVSFLLGK